MYSIYKYISVKDGLVKYVGISNILNRRLKEHAKSDLWASSEKFIVEKFDVETRSEAEAWESHLISLYGSDKHYNKFKKNWGTISFLENCIPPWTAITNEELESLIKQTKKIKSIIGMTKQMNCGLSCTIIKENDDGSIDVEFENGKIVEHTTLNKFNRKRIRFLEDNETHLRQASSRARSRKLGETRLGETKCMNCGLNATIIEYVNSHDISVKFETGEILEHVRYQYFNRQQLRPESMQLNKVIFEQEKTTSKNRKIGKEKTMECGLICRISNYINNNDIDVIFPEIDQVIKHTSIASFNLGILAPLDFNIDTNAAIIPLNAENTNERLYERRIMNCGIIATIIAYEKSNNITVQFDTGEVRTKISYAKFKQGAVGRRPSSNAEIQRKRTYYKHINEVRCMNNGAFCKIIDFRSPRDMDVEFESGSIRYNVRYDHFVEGSISEFADSHFSRHIGLPVNERLGETREMKNGKTATIIEYYHAKDITIKLDDGSILFHRRYDRFVEGNIA